MRSIEMRNRAREQDAEMARISEVVHRPLRTLFEQDKVAVDELQHLLGQRRSTPDVDSDSFMNPDPSAFRIEDTVPNDRESLITNAEDTNLAAGAAGGVRVPPFDFDWMWRRQDGSPPTISLADRTTGRVLLEGSSGPLVPPHSSGKFVEVHAGCGLFAGPLPMAR